MNHQYQRRAMREGNNKQFRPEQFKLQKYFEVYAPAIKTELEFAIADDKRRFCVAIVDLADLTNMIAWRLHGGIHGLYGTKRDEEQKIILEQQGWTVIDVFEDSFEWNWLWL